MCLSKIEIKIFCLGVFARTLACIGRQLHTALDSLNSTWYRFALYSAAKVARWPNQTTGELLPITYHRVPTISENVTRETWV